jgi:rhodanese-related sulfurtransferase
MNHFTDEVSPADLASQMAAGRAPYVLDVRSAGEYRRGHVPGAAHVPFWLLPLRMDLVTAGREDPVVIYCGHGPRAAFARMVLQRRGYRDVRLLAGHMSRWRQERLPVSTDP